MTYCFRGTSLDPLHTSDHFFVSHNKSEISSWPILHEWSWWTKGCCPSLGGGSRTRQWTAEESIACVPLGLFDSWFLRSGLLTACSLHWLDLFAVDGLISWFWHSLLCWTTQLLIRPNHYVQVWGWMMGGRIWVQVEPEDLFCGVLPNMRWGEH